MTHEAVLNQYRQKPYIYKLFKKEIILTSRHNGLGAKNRNEEKYGFTSSKTAYIRKGCGYT